MVDSCNKLNSAKLTLKVNTTWLKRKSDLKLLL